MKIFALNPYNIYKKQQDISFGTTGKRYITPTGDDIGNDSWFYREDIDWKKFALLEKELFKDKAKVNIVEFAASDGSEAYTQIMSILENNPKPDDNKFFPIMAYDIDPEITKAAKSGYINTFPFDRLNIQMGAEDSQKYFLPAEKFLNMSKDGFLNDKNAYWYSERSLTGSVRGIKTLKAQKILTDKVIFHNEDMYKILANLKDNSNTILMCRNILGYFDERQIENFIKQVSNKLKSGSLFLIGNHDTRNSHIEQYLRDNGFMGILKNVYRKI